jgi:predicted enzyme related to lactoylglutathione lyase
LSLLARPSLIEFPADDPERARRFWSGVLGEQLQPRSEGQGTGWQTETETAVGVHVRGRGPGDSFSLAYFTVSDMPTALEHVVEYGGAVVHPGEVWAICRDSEGSPFGLALSTDGSRGSSPRESIE